LSTLAWIPVSFDKCQLEAITIPFLQEEGAAEANDFALSHDADSVSKHISFVHVVGRQHDDPISPLVTQHIPQGSSRVEIHTCSWFIEDHKA